MCLADGGGGMEMGPTAAAGPLMDVSVMLDGDRHELFFFFLVERTTGTSFFFFERTTGTSWSVTSRLRAEMFTGPTNTPVLGHKTPVQAVPGVGPLKLR